MLQFDFVFFAPHSTYDSWLFSWHRLEVAGESRINPLPSLSALLHSCLSHLRSLLWIDFLPIFVVAHSWGRSPIPSAFSGPDTNTFVNISSIPPSECVKLFL
jgi:hypothetical protein